MVEILIDTPSAVRNSILKLISFKLIIVSNNEKHIEHSILFGFSCSLCCSLCRYQENLDAQKGCTNRDPETTTKTTKTEIAILPNFSLAHPLQKKKRQIKWNEIVTKDRETGRKKESNFSSLFDNTGYMYILLPLGASD